MPTFCTKSDDGKMSVSSSKVASDVKIRIEIRDGDLGTSWLILFGCSWLFS